MAQREMDAAGFDTVRAEECSYTARLTDAGAMACYLKAVSWDAPDFDMDRGADRMLALHRHIEASGVFDARIHQFLLVARNP